jgi:hypothetical protein
MIIAFDLDGTLANIEHRLHYIKNKPTKWPAFFDACTDDLPVLPVIMVCNRLIWSGCRIEVWSGRSDRVRPQTERWLDKHAINYATLRMRKDGDYRQDSIVKAEWFDALPIEQRPVIAFDDRQQVVDMWRSKGVICCQVAPGNF